MILPDNFMQRETLGGRCLRLPGSRSRTDPKAPRYRICFRTGKGEDSVICLEDEFGFEGRLVAVPEVYLGYKDAVAREP